MFKEEELKFTSIISVAKNLHKWVFFVNSRNFRVHDDENFARIKILFLILFLIILFTPFQFASSESQIPHIISYQGRLYDNEGNLLGGNGTTYYFRFSIWDSSATGTKLWPDKTPSIVPINVEWGVFNAQIGDVSQGFDPLTLDFTKNQYYLQIEIATLPDFSDGEILSPRQRITSSGYAFNAETLQGFTASQNPLAHQIPVLDENGNLVLNGKINNATISGGVLSGGFYSGTSIVPEGDFSIGTSTLSLTLNASDLFIKSNLKLEGQLSFGQFSSPPLPYQIGSVYYDTSQNDLFIWNGLIWKSLTQGGATSTLQSAYDYSPSPAGILTSNNKDIRVILQDTEVDSNFLVELQGEESSFQILKSSVPYLTAQNFKNQIQIGSGMGVNNPTLLILDTKNTLGDPPCVNGAIYYNSKINKFRVCENNQWKTIITIPIPH